MPFFTLPNSIQNANGLYTTSSNSQATLNNPSSLSSSSSPFTVLTQKDSLLFQDAVPHSPHPSLPYLMLLVFEAVLEVVCVSLPGYVLARMGMFDGKAQKFVANLNVMLFTPCLIFTKLASQLTAGKLVDLAIIPFIFVTQTAVSYICASVISRCFRFKKRQSNFVTAMGVFGNSNSLPISLVISLSKTLQGLHWDRVPNDNDGEVAARGILYLLIFQQLGQLLRWSWGYHVLLAPREQYYRDEEERANARIRTTEGRYSDIPDESTDQTLVGTGQNTGTTTPQYPSSSESGSSSSFVSGGQTPVMDRQHSYSKLPTSHSEHLPVLVLLDGAFLPRENEDGNGHITQFPNVEAAQDEPLNTGQSNKWVQKCRWAIVLGRRRFSKGVTTTSKRAFYSLPLPIQKSARWTSQMTSRFVRGLWAFMNPPLWAMLAAIFVASVPSLQRLMFTPGTFVSNSFTRAVEQSGGVAVPLILVVLGANLERSTLPEEALEDQEHPKEERNLIIASLMARMLLPFVFMGPIIAFTAKFVPVSILDDPIFVIVCFLLVGAPSALQLAQICQINNVYMSAMSKILFHSYVIWILPSTLILVMSALQVVQWAAV